MAYDLAAMLKEVSESDTGREQIEYIPLDLLASDEKNFYEISGIPALADNIATVGLQQPLRVRRHPTEDGRYMIVSGHRRRAALELLAKDEPERWSEVACIVEQDAVSPALQQLKLIFANSGTRKLSSSDLNEQVAQVEKLLYQLQEEGYEFPGRMRDHVARVMQTTNTKLAVLKKIREHLAECWQPLYKKGKLPENTAYELAKISPEAQKILFDIRMQNDPKLGSFGADDAKAFAKTCEEIEKLRCKRRGRPCECLNADNKKKRAAALHYSSTCYCTKCCADCPDLISCRYACSVMSDKIKQMKNDRKEANRQAKLDQEEKDRPTIELLQRLWYRFGYAREQANVSIKSALLAVGKMHSKNAEKSVKDLEDCTAKFNVSTTEAPYGFSYDLRYIRTLCTLADMFGCSVDYLLCRTDVPNFESDASGEQGPQAPASGKTEFIPGNWYPSSVEPPLDAKIVIVDDCGYADIDTYIGSGQLKNESIVKWDEVVLWAPFPQKATATKLPEFPQGWILLQWLPGLEIPHEPIRAQARFDMNDGYPPVEVTAYWRGQNWQFKDGTVIEGQCLSWFPLPSEIPKGKTGSTLNSSCKTGMSPSGHCGAAGRR